MKNQSVSNVSITLEPLVNILVGLVHLPTHKDAGGKVPPVEWCSTQTTLLPPGKHQFPVASLFYKCDSFTVADHSSAPLGSHVIMRRNQTCLDEVSNDILQSGILLSVASLF